mmetsp:Transcript_19022/g.48594  ORF Transcript_19022/g.48594 Transcript_19022/m.48594 type:complete len:81 (+) Transcript_19022:457-699(+)|eukprot:CAMPEP_0113872780 /NCGR_PEP_ID=MMETSP0780_2-20120614/3405_1 /TAXON_ID=652834 /ORGANISM="Palpitomonas bilix" /LENGTH=80 /DNA_ID=CAMNT_0000858353 /DNA_START=634 /DNA_END=876 /DNA_ORIENTATION=- /assembly_acc=CAM_ASM_000599
MTPNEFVFYLYDIAVFSFFWLFVVLPFYSPYGLNLCRNVPTAGIVTEVQRRIRKMKGKKKEGTEEDELEPFLPSSADNRV